LLFPFQLAACHHKFSFFSPQIVSFHFELAIKSLLNHRLAFLLALAGQLAESVCHLLSHLFRRFQIGKELSFIQLVLSY
jgi:hypothetical protein